MNRIQRPFQMTGLMNIPINLLWILIILAFLIGLTPAFVTFINMEQQSNFLNCPGYVYNGDATSSLSYNATIGTTTGTTIACLAINLYIPYIMLGVLLASVAYILYGKQIHGPEQSQGYY